MNMNPVEKSILTRLRAKNTYGPDVSGFGDERVFETFTGSNVAFVSGWGELETVFDTAVSHLGKCIQNHHGQAILQEGGVYHGCWLESTGTASAEVLSRFVPDVAESTMLAFVQYQRSDGLIPFMITRDGPVYRQIQLVTPPVRSAWHHYRIANPDDSFLTRIEQAYTRYDEWLTGARDTRKTGCIEAFCTFDTGHDLSPRFWHVPNSPYNGEPDRYDPDNPRLPFVAPDLTAAVACNRDYLARIQAERGGDGNWDRAARIMREALLEHCFDTEDRCFYDRDATGSFVRVQSDVLMRVMACESVSLKLFEELLQTYLLNTRKFYSQIPFTSIALDDPRFFQSSNHNSWAGAVNFLTLLRIPHMFEHYGHTAEFMTAANQAVQAFADIRRFSQCLNPWTGEEGFTELYSPAILAILDYMERLHGIQQASDGTIWCNAKPTTRDTEGHTDDRTSGYRRTVSGMKYELVCTHERAHLLVNGKLSATFPTGVRLVCDRAGQILGLKGLLPRTVSGALHTYHDYEGHEHATSYPIAVSANETFYLEGSKLRRTAKLSYVPPQF